MPSLAEQPVMEKHETAACVRGGHGRGQEFWQFRQVPWLPGAIQVTFTESSDATSPTRCTHVEFYQHMPERSVAVDNSVSDGSSQSLVPGRTDSSCRVVGVASQSAVSNACCRAWIWGGSYDDDSDPCTPSPPVDPLHSTVVGNLRATLLFVRTVHHRSTAQ